MLTKGELDQILSNNIGFPISSATLKRVDTDLNALVEIGLKALDANQLDFARKIFILAKTKGYKLANRYLAIIEKKSAGKV